MRFGWQGGEVKAGVSDDRKQVALLLAKLNHDAVVKLKTNRAVFIGLEIETYMSLEISEQRGKVFVHQQVLP